MAALQPGKQTVWLSGWADSRACVSAAGTGLSWSCTVPLQTAPCACAALVWGTHGFVCRDRLGKVPWSCDLGWRQVGWCCSPLGRELSCSCCWGLLPAHMQWGWSSVSSLELAVWRKPIGTGQAAGRAECCVRELLARLGECLMFKRSET